jgi:transcriptional regulator with XRE-family HTH domain
MSINQLIVSRRTEKGYSTSKLARLAGIAQSTLREIEIGNTSPTWDTIVKISKALDISPIQLISDPSSESSYSELPPNLLQLIESVKKLPPEERKALLKGLNEYLKVRLSFMDETSAAKEETKGINIVSESGAKYAETKESVYNTPLVGPSAAGTPMTAIGYHEGNFEAPEK